METTLRLFNLDDLEKVVEFANNPKIAENLLDVFPHPYTIADGNTFLNRAMSGDPIQVFAICFNDEFCGAIGIHPQEDIFRKNAELGYWIAEPFWGKRITSKAVKLMCDYGFENFDISRIFARPFGHNTASKKVLENAGFEHEATLSKTIFKNGEYCDELFYAIRK